MMKKHRLTKECCQLPYFREKFQQTCTQLLGHPRPGEEVGTKSQANEAHFLSSDLCILTYQRMG